MSNNFSSLSLQIAPDESIPMFDMEGWLTEVVNASPEHNSWKFFTGSFLNALLTASSAESPFGRYKKLLAYFKHTTEVTETDNAKKLYKDCIREFGRYKSYSSFPADVYHEVEYCHMVVMRCFFAPSQEHLRWSYILSSFACAKFPHRRNEQKVTDYMVGIMNCLIKNDKHAP